MSTRYLVAVGNEIRKGLRFAWSERLQILIELPMFGVFILLLGPLLGQGEVVVGGEVEWALDSATTSVMLVWFVPFIFFYMQVVKMFWRLLGEIQAGTIEQVYLSPLPPWLVAAVGRVVAAFLETLLVAAGTVAIVAPFVPIRVDWNAAALLPAAMIMLAAVGVSLIVAGATLVWKQIQFVNDTVLLVVMLFSASAVPLIDVPAWWADASHAFPLTDGVGSLYTALFTDGSVTEPWGMGGLVPLLVVTFSYLAAGIVAFGFGERVAKRRGTLGRY
ncbi:ABC-2 family transporter [Haloactinopolyspora alba]|uniref:ABC-2 family transporter n=1 Tax=Haloactinopolyspora alba TaxID=648780 RepID=A0A2P8DWP4_9ACTN|nr:ABC transporter permease [Haloactinopolyspora alba]PSL01648.1 ABC-2 family transporter [Haloactinopolyspora alba]